MEFNDTLYASVKSSTIYDALESENFPEVTHHSTAFSGTCSSWEHV